MLHAYTKDQFVDQSTIDSNVLETRGWATFTTSSSCEADTREQLLTFASGLGTPAVTRSGGGLCDTLLPTRSEAAKPQSLSKIHSIGEFPLHNDTAHWLTPCRYVMLACVSPGSAGRPTLLMDTQRLPLDERQSSLLHSTPLRVTNGRNSFFSTILSKARPFVRFDPGCMTAITPGGAEVMGIVSRYNTPEHVVRINWESGKVLVLDNWRILHGRGYAERPDSDRKLLRISIR